MQCETNEDIVGKRKLSVRSVEHKLRLVRECSQLEFDRAAKTEQEAERVRAMTSGMSKRYAARRRYSTVVRAGLDRWG